jgi:hypothetical protein
LGNEIETSRIEKVSSASDSDRVRVAPAGRPDRAAVVSATERRDRDERAASVERRAKRTQRADGSRDALPHAVPLAAMRNDDAEPSRIYGGEPVSTTIGHGSMVSREVRELTVEEQRKAQLLELGDAGWRIFLASDIDRTHAQYLVAGGEVWTIEHGVPPAASDGTVRLVAGRLVR